MWDEQTKFYYTVIRANGQKVMRRLNAAFWMLWAGLADQHQKDELVKALFDPKQFFAPIPIPQMALNDPDFDAKVGHWGDGHSWPIDSSIAFDGLLRYGEWDKAAEFARHYNQGVFKVIEKTCQPSELL
jgi:putative isomerase